MTTETLREERPDEDRRLAIRHLTLGGGSDFAELNRRVNAAGLRRRRPTTTPYGRFVVSMLLVGRWS